MQCSAFGAAPWGALNSMPDEEGSQLCSDEQGPTHAQLVVGQRGRH